MLQHTFIHIPGLGAQTERALWSQGCLRWDDFLGGKYSSGSAPITTARKVLEESRDALAFSQHQYFAKKLKAKDAWRAYSSFRESAVYLDIETSGGDDVTMVGLWDGSRFRALVQGEDLGNFPDVISHYSMIVTFFGAGFDIPVLQKRFPGLKLDQIHVDLCPVLKTLGYRGGLKRIEKEFGIEREPGIAGLGGYDAVKLWRRYKMLGDDRAMDTLIAYNRADCVNLETLAIAATNKLQRLMLPQP